MLKESGAAPTTMVFDGLPLLFQAKNTYKTFPLSLGSAFKCLIIVIDQVFGFRARQAVLDQGLELHKQARLAEANSV
ncbi:hypothetical protein MAM1_0364d10060 [Mucor ambiguus]|uniref:Uncharacterized protein n=1 Tax=Mucor ambiguus TaxID=91626 RepID=A0A0C9MSU9_9FUNG|nr:hypothetical protein MAM1_0364d10060 [Mucor ambiguus]